MKNQIFEMVKSKPATSFVELSHIAGFSGDYEFYNPKYNVVYWAGISLEAHEALNSLLSEKLIEMSVSEWFVYLIDGMTLSYPRAKQVKSYKTPHWLPVVFWLPVDLRAREAMRKASSGDKHQ